MRKGLRIYSRKRRGKAREMGYLKKAGDISVDGVKIHANASWHNAVSYKRAVEMIVEAELTVPEETGRARNGKRRLKRRSGSARRRRSGSVRRKRQGKMRAGTA
jgi:hypothetical protein